MASKRNEGPGAASPRSRLAEYRRKRDFSKTAEPSGGEATSRPGALRF